MPCTCPASYWCVLLPYPAVRSQVSAPARDLLKAMLERNPAKRIRAADALRHPWLQARSVVGEGCWLRMLGCVLQPPDSDMVLQVERKNLAPALLVCPCAALPPDHNPAAYHPTLPQDADSTSSLPLRSSVVQRLQRFATYGHLKQVGAAGV